MIVFLGKLIKKAGRTVGGFVRRAAPVLRSVARVAAPVAGIAAVALLASRRSRSRPEEAGRDDPNDEKSR
ncbi:MAG: hypothetical protein H0U81_13480 [Pyrinomonadaceae bacterium]|nr:hypothetical protein [Pyrinomonadaceae bacterium]